VTRGKVVVDGAHPIEAMWGSRQWKHFKISECGFCEMWKMYWSVL
jgi:hypothetical protein